MSFSIKSITLECSCGNVFVVEHHRYFKCPACNQYINKTTKSSKESKAIKILKSLGYTLDQIKTATGDAIFENDETFIKEVVKYHENIRTRKSDRQD